MNININYVAMPFNEKITDYIIKTLNILKGCYPWISGAEVSLKRISEADEIKETCEIELNISGITLFASSLEEKCENAAREATLEINKLLRKRKTVLKAR